jgi:hypothetical protein
VKQLTPNVHSIVPVRLGRVAAKAHLNQGCKNAQQVHAFIYWNKEGNRNPVNRENCGKKAK